MAEICRIVGAPKAVSSRFCTPWPIQITLVMTRLPVGIPIGLKTYLLGKGIRS